MFLSISVFVLSSAFDVFNLDIELILKRFMVESLKVSAVSQKFNKFMAFCFCMYSIKYGNTLSSTRTSVRDLDNCDFLGKVATH